MTVKELKKYLDRFDDDTVIMIECPDRDDINNSEVWDAISLGYYPEKNVITISTEEFELASTAKK